MHSEIRLKKHLLDEESMTVSNILANSQDLVEMPHTAAFQQGLQCLLRYKKIFRDRNSS